MATAPSRLPRRRAKEDTVPASRSAGRPRSAGEPARANGSIVESIIEKIKDGVRDRRFAPGQRLIENDIQRAVGASRGPVREAMRRLAAEGLIDLQHYKGARVRALTPEEVTHLYEVREALEGLAARLAAETADSGRHRQRLAALEAEYERAGDRSAAAFMRYNERFHALVVELSGSDILIRLVAQLHVPVYTLRFHDLVGRYLDEARREHRDIVAAILAGDGTRAERAMRRHVRGRLRQILAGFESGVR
ncbi:MAG: GntR family transcriptional regulator [Rhodospirillaceae bacterium]|nr:GntR family transcriptional regulator [Rhodospirillaceae bacterium]